MAKVFSKNFYESKSWRQCRESYLISQQYICERCGGIATTVHHKIYLSPKNINDVNITLSWDNLEAVCAECHQLEHHKAKSNIPYTFDGQGNIVYPPSKK